jgi:hypothetical protein
MGSMLTESALLVVQVTVPLSSVMTLSPILR